MENRYDDKLREGNQLIISLSSANQVLRIILALELKKIFTKNKDIKVLEIGCGEGDSVAYILKYNRGLKLDVLDISEEMIKITKENLKEYGESLNFICGDALEYLRKTESYDLITASWTIHNFKWIDKLVLFKEIFNKLKLGGKLLIMDKIYPDDKNISKEFLDVTNKRYRYLGEDLEREMVLHEQQDYGEEFRMDESQTIEELEKIGFRNVRVIERVEREIVLIAERIIIPPITTQIS